MKALNALADRVVSIVVPKAAAMAACSGSFSFCTPCRQFSPYGCLYYCNVKPNCDDSCTLVAFC